MKHTIKKGEHEFSPKIGGWRIHSGVTLAEWRGHFHENTWYEPAEGPNNYNLGSGWSYGKARKHAIRWVWRPVKHADQKLQEVGLLTLEEGMPTISTQTILLPLGEDFFVRLKTNGTFASLAARTFTGDWEMVTNKWTARPKKGFWLGLAFNGQHSSPQDMALELRRLMPVA